jgi:hypothetical protein
MLLIPALQALRSQSGGNYRGPCRPRLENLNPRSAAGEHRDHGNLRRCQRSNRVFDEAGNHNAGIARDDATNAFGILADNFPSEA